MSTRGQASQGGAVTGQVTMDGTVLEAVGLTKSFHGFTAVDNVHLKVRRGQIHALIGPNGAGKTTFFNLLTKFVLPTSGSIRFQGIDITRERPAETARRGLVRSFQISAVFAHLPVLDNVRVALQRRHGKAYHFWRSDSVLRSLDQRAHELLGEVGLESFADRSASDLAYGQKRALELATTLAMEPELMLLDEPTQGMGHEDVGTVTRLIRKVSAGRTVLMVEHNMSVVAGLCDTISVLQRGRVIAEGTYAQVSRNPEVIEAYMGDPDEALGGGHA